MYSIMSLSVHAIFYIEYLPLIEEVHEIKVRSPLVGCPTHHCMFAKLSNMEACRIGRIDVSGVRVPEAQKLCVGAEGYKIPATVVEPAGSYTAMAPQYRSPFQTCSRIG